MKKRRYRTKSKKVLTTIISIILIVGIIGALIFVLTPKSTKTLRPKFYVGSLNSAGEFIENDDQIVSDMFACEGLTISSKFNTTTEYIIYFYNYDKLSLGKTKIMKGDFDLVKSEYYSLAVKYARILLIPDIGDEAPEDHKIRMWNIPKISNDIKINVNNKQSTLKDYYSLEAECGVWEKRSENGYGVNTIIFSKKPLKPIDCSNINSIILIPVEGTNASSTNITYLLDSTANFVDKEAGRLIIDVSGANFLYVSVPVNMNFNIYAYS